MLQGHFEAEGVDHSEVYLLWLPDNDAPEVIAELRCGDSESYSTVYWQLKLYRACVWRSRRLNIHKD